MATASGLTTMVVMLSARKDRHKFYLYEIIDDFENDDLWHGFWI
jgi:hypothetical protein